MNYRAVVQYDGTNYYGFQVQTKQQYPTIQKAIEDAIEKLTGSRIRIAASGRTDRGVHARAQVISFQLYTVIPLKNFQAALNNILPPDIRLCSIRTVGSDFHARFSCKNKTYRYIIDTRERTDVFSRNHVWRVQNHLDVDSIRGAAEKLVGTHDFTSFAQKSGRYETCVRTVHSCNVRQSRGRIVIDITADGFLQGMVRNIVGLLVDIGAGRRSTYEIYDVLNARSRGSVGMAAPACGLYLWRVTY
jgi:tRNA pseudouridine38-40 synthase